MLYFSVDLRRDECTSLFGISGPASKQTIKLEEAAELMGLAAEEIEWALEEFGECESEDYIATQPD